MFREISPVWSNHNLQEISKLIRIKHILDLNIASINLLFDEKGFKLCEVNSSPGFEGIEQAMGKDIADEIIQFVKLKPDSIKRKR